MLLTSFLQSQKSSIQRVLLKSFDRYLHRPAETHQSLQLILDKLARQKALIHKMREGIEEEERVSVLIKRKELEQEAAEFKITTIEDFLASGTFRKRY